MQTNLDLEPELLAHDENYRETVDDFIEKVKHHLGDSIGKDKIAVLFRSRSELNKFINTSQNNFKFENLFKTSKKNITKFKNRLSNSLEIDDENDIKNYTENILKGEYYFLNDNFIKGFKEFEKAFIKIKSKKFNNVNSLIKESNDEKGLYNHRKDVWNFIELFEKPTKKNQLIDEWIDINNGLLLKNGKFYLNKIKTKDKISRTSLNTILTWNMLDLNIIETTSNYYCGTIHSVKGKSFDAVLLLLKSNCKNILGEELMEEKELRNVYVGMSRARHILDIAVPKNDLNKWKEFFNGKINQHSLDEFFK